MPTKQIDADTVPPAVAKQEAAAVAAQKKLQGEGSSDPEPAPEPNKEPLKPTHPTPDPEPAPDPEPISFVPPAIADPKADDDSSYKNKYDVLKGKYDAEVPALQGQIQSLQLVVSQMQQTLETQAAAASASPARVETGIKALNPEDYEEYGEGIVSLAKGFNALLNQNEQLVAQMQKPATSSDLVQRTERLESALQQSAEERYYDDLTRAVPDWRTINRSGAFDQWLREIDPISMAARMDILQYAASNFNAKQVINIFNQFKADSGMVQAPGKSAPAPNVPVENEHLSGQVMPDANLANPNEMQPSGVNVQYPTTSELKQASTDFVAKRITEEQYNDISSRYQLAVKAGKVMP
jgi:hypothetical protein